MKDKLSIEEFAEGKMIFKREEEDGKAYWLLFGAIDLLDKKFEAKNRKASDDAARYPIDNNNPHRLTAITTEASKILKHRENCRWKFIIHDDFGARGELALIGCLPT